MEFVAIYYAEKVSVFMQRKIFKKGNSQVAEFIDEYRPALNALAK
jgi:hypothetical protein